MKAELNKLKINYKLEFAVYKAELNQVKAQAWEEGFVKGMANRDNLEQF